MTLGTLNFTSSCAIKISVFIFYGGNAVGPGNKGRLYYTAVADRTVLTKHVDLMDALQAPNVSAIPCDKNPTLSRLAT